MTVFVEFFPWDGIGVVPSYCVDDFPELVLVVTVTQLAVNKFQVGDVELSLSLDVQQIEVGPPSVLGEGVALD